MTKISEATATTLQQGDLIPLSRPGQAAGDKFAAPIPSWTSWSPTYAGFSVNPTITCLYLLIGKMCYCRMTVTGHGTNNVTSASGITFTLPFTSGTVGASFFIRIRHDNTAVGLVLLGLVQMYVLCLGIMQ